MALLLLALSACGAPPLVSKQRLIGLFTADSTNLAFVDGALASTDPGLEGQVIKVFDAKGKPVLSAPVDVVGERRGVRSISLGSRAVASLESSMLRGVVRVRSLDGSAVVEPEVHGFALALTRTPAGFLWVEAQIVSTADLNGDGVADHGTTQLTLVETDEVGAVLSRTLVTTPDPLVNRTGLLTPFPTGVGAHVREDEVVFAWDASGFCDGSASVLRIARSTGVGTVTWTGAKADTGPAGGSTCQCASTPNNAAEALDFALLGPGGQVLLAGRKMACASLAGGTAFLKVGAEETDLSAPVRSLFTDGAQVFAASGLQLFRLDDPGYLPFHTAAQSIAGVALRGPQLLLATQHDITLVPR